MRGAKKEAAAEVGKSVCIAAIVTLAAVLVFALLVKLFTIGSGAITAVNQVIKAVAIFVGCMVCVKPGRGLLKGLVSGVAVIILTYFLFAILAGRSPSAGRTFSISCSARSWARSAGSSRGLSKTSKDCPPPLRG